MQFGDPDECWPWLGAKVRDGRGRIRIGSAQEGWHYVPRVAFWVCQGYWPEYALHLSPECNNASCCNPLHIYDGSMLDNAADRRSAGTTRRLLTDQQAMEIYRRRQAGEPIPGLAEEFRVSKVTISHIATGRAYGDVTLHKKLRK